MLVGQKDSEHPTYAIAVVSFELGSEYDVIPYVDFRAYPRVIQLQGTTRPPEENPKENLARHQAISELREPLLVWDILAQTIILFATSEGFESVSILPASANRYRKMKGFKPEIAARTYDLTAEHNGFMPNRMTGMWSLDLSK